MYRAAAQIQQVCRLKTEVVLVLYFRFMPIVRRVGTALMVRASSVYQLQLYDPESGILRFADASGVPTRSSTVDGERNVFLQSTA